MDIRRHPKLSHSQIQTKFIFRVTEEALTPAVPYWNDLPAGLEKFEELELIARSKGIFMVGRMGAKQLGKNAKTCENIAR